MIKYYTWHINCIFFFRLKISCILFSKRSSAGRWLFLSYDDFSRSICHHTTSLNRFCTCTIEPLSALWLFLRFKRSFCATLCLSHWHYTAVTNWDCLSCAIFQMRLLLAFAGCLCLLLSLTFRRHLPYWCLARKPNQDTQFKFLPRHMTAHAWLSSAKRYRMTFRQESHSIAPALILAFNRCLLALQRITFTLRQLWGATPSSKMVTVVTEGRKVPIPTGISIRLKV